jgi:hypothetical protein
MSWDDFDENAHFRLELILRHDFDHFCLPNFNCNPLHADARPISRHALFYSWKWRQLHDVHQPHLGVGTPRSLHLNAPGFRRVFRGSCHFFRKKDLWLRVDDLGAHQHRDPLLHCVASPFFCHGSKSWGQFLFCRYDHGHCDPHGGSLRSFEEKSISHRRCFGFSHFYSTLQWPV